MALPLQTYGLDYCDRPCGRLRHLRGRSEHGESVSQMVSLVSQVELQILRVFWRLFASKNTAALKSSLRRRQNRFRRQIFRRRRNRLLNRSDRRNVQKKLSHVGTKGSWPPWPPHW